MVLNQSPADHQTFFSIAVELKLLSAEVAEELAVESTADEIHPAHLVIRKGLLNPIDIDIIETLSNPTESVTDFEILGLLGKGGMGVVYRARQKSLDRIVALKTILVSQLADPSLAARFEREAMTVARLQHPNIVAAYDFGKHDGRMYFVMELVEGQDVDQLIAQQKQLDEATALGLIRQAAAGLSHATQLGIVHRDIKPANLLLVEPPAGFELPSGLPMVKIADFGLAFLSNEAQTDTRLTAANATLGSPNYMAPEQIAGEPVDHRADIYALGASLYHMLTGRAPFDANSISKIIAQKLSGKFIPAEEENPKVSKQTSQLIMEMMDNDLETRFSDYTTLLNRVDELLRQSPTSVLPTQVMSKSEMLSRPIQNELNKTIIAESQDTVLLPGSFQRKNGVNKFRLGIISAVTVAILAGIVFSFGLLKSEKRAAIPPRDMIRGGWSKSLFNGKSLGAFPINGSWIVDEDEESGQVIAGTSGTIRQPLLRKSLKGIRPLSDYRLLLFIRLHQAAAVELQFGITVDENKKEGNYSLLRITPEQLTLGTKNAETGQFSDVVEGRTQTIDPQKLHVLQLEYQHGVWWVLFDEQVVGTVNSPTVKHLPEFRLKVEGGPAWFSDLSVEELVSKTTENTE